MEGLASLYASSSSSSSDSSDDGEDETERKNSETERFGEIVSASKPLDNVVEEENTIRPSSVIITSSIQLDKLSSQKEEQQHNGGAIMRNSGGLKDQQEHDDPTKQQQLDNHSRQHYPTKKARRTCIVKFITLQESNTCKKKSNDNMSKPMFVRSQPHVPGNWAGHVFVKLSPLHHDASSSSSSSWDTTWKEAETRGLERIRKRLESSCLDSSCVTVVVHEPMNWHVSLSRPFYLQAAFIDSFVQELEQSLLTAPTTRRSTDTTRSRTIRILPHQCTLLVNDDKTRSFWVWPIQPSLEDLVQIVDRILILYQQPTYYQPAHFHISVASVAEDLSMVWNNNNNDCHNSIVHNNESSSTDDDDDEEEEEEDESLYAKITSVHCVIGNKSFTFPLRV